MFRELSNHAHYTCHVDQLKINGLNSNFSDKVKKFTHLIEFESEMRTGLSSSYFLSLFVSINKSLPMAKSKCGRRELIGD